MLELSALSLHGGVFWQLFFIEEVKWYIFWFGFIRCIGTLIGCFYKKTLLFGKSHFRKVQVFCLIIEIFLINHLFTLFDGKCCRVATPLVQNWTESESTPFGSEAYKKCCYSWVLLYWKRPVALVTLAIGLPGLATIVKYEDKGMNTEFHTRNDKMIDISWHVCNTTRYNRGMVFIEDTIMVTIVLDKTYIEG